MKIIDLSPVLNAKTPVYPGDLPFALKQESFGGFCTGSIKMCLHTGSHTDFAKHCEIGGKRSDEISLKYFVGEAVCVSVSANLGEAVKFTPPKNPNGAKILVLDVRFKIENSDDYFINSPFLDEDFLNLALSSGFHTIATNLSTIDKYGFNSRHIEAFKNRIQIIECLTNLQILNGKSFFFSAAPLKITGADAAPLRAYAIL